MSLYVDKMFVSRISIRLERFHQKSEYLWNFRCPICGDSHKNKIKARGYIYRRKSDLFFTCHNCGTSISFGNFVKTLDTNLHKEYLMECFKNKNSNNRENPDFSWAKIKFPVKKQDGLLINLPTIESLSTNHESKSFITKRQIPIKWHSSIYYAADFREFVLSMLPNYEDADHGYGKKLHENEPRIIIPFYDEDNQLLGFQGRSLDPNNKVKYMTIKMAEDNRKVFGLDKIDKTKRIYVVEGPIDSMFLDNSIAMMDASLHTALQIVGLDNDYVFVYDNEPRNKDVCRHMEKTITLNQNICIWPSHIKEKDINDMVLSGLSSATVQGIIYNHTFNTHRAMLEFGQWKKI